MTDNEKLWTDFENHLLNIQVTRKRISKLKVMFNICSRALNLGSAKREDVEDFINDLNRNRFKKDDGTEYSGNSKSDIKKFLKQYFKHTKGKDEFYSPEVSWLKTNIAKDEKPGEKPIIEIDEVVQLAQRFVKYDYKILTLLLFDSGFRIQEIMSCKKKDLTWDNFDDKRKCFWLKCNISKTFPRNIPVPLFTTEVKSFHESSYYKSKKDDDLLFDVSYEAYNKMLKKYSQELFKTRIITPHCLRHSSATFYAKEYSGNVPLLAQRYGWSYSAQELQTYVRNSGAYNKEGAKISFKNEVVKVREENEELKEQIKEMQEDIDTQEQSIKKLVASVEILLKRQK